MLRKTGFIEPGSDRTRFVAKGRVIWPTFSMGRTVATTASCGIIQVLTVAAVRSRLCRSDFLPSFSCPFRS